MKQILIQNFSYKSKRHKKNIEMQMQNTIHMYTISNVLNASILKMKHIHLFCLYIGQHLTFEHMYIVQHFRSGTHISIQISYQKIASIVW